MAWEHLSITKPHLVYIILGGFTSLFMLCSSVIKERLYIGEATVATICGIIFGPHAANLINPNSWGNTDLITLEFSRIVLVVQCFAVGVELPKAYMERHWKSVTLLLIPVMTWGWLITSLFVWWLFKSHLNWLDSLCVAACVTATDPVLASSVVGKGKFARRVPKHLRDLLSAESGCNDGMAFPFVYLALYIIRYKHHPNEVALHWFCFTILYECVFGAIYGVLVGYFARRAIRYAHEHDLIDRESFLVFYFVLALFCAGSGSLLGMDDLLVGFACGVGFSNDGWFLEKTEESHVSNVIDLLINLAFFVYFGTIIPWETFNAEAIIGISPWRLVVLGILVLLFRRIPIMLLLKPIIPDVKTWREALFAGHFGPIGVGGLFVAILARAELETESTTPLAALPEEGFEHLNIIEMIWPITTFLVIVSIIVHGSSIAVFTLGKRINTLQLTFSYTQANEEGPSWMDRLPRIQSRSKSQASFRRPDDTDASSMDEKNEYPPGMLPPLGIAGNFLRRQREEDNSSRSSSLRPSARRRRWDTGLGPGGPISQSAIAPQRIRDQNDPSASRRDSETIAGSSDPSPESSVQKDRQNTPEGEEIFDEGDHIIIEDKEGNVLEVLKSHGESDRQKLEQAKAEGKRLRKQKHVEGGVSQDEHGHVPGDHGKTPALSGEDPADHPESAGWQDDKKPKEAEADHHERPGWRGDIRKMMGSWRGRHDEEESPQPRKEAKRGAARAYQFGNTIIVEDEDGEVLKKYDIPAPKRPGVERQGTFGEARTRQRVQRMGKLLGMGHHEEEGEAGPSGTPKKGGDDDKDDEKIRFTIAAGGRRMSKAEFIKQIQALDPKARAQLVEDSNVPEAVKREARADVQEHEMERGRRGAPDASLQGAQQLKPTSGPTKTTDPGTGSKDRSPAKQPLSSDSSTEKDIPFHAVGANLMDAGRETAAMRRRRHASASEEADPEPDVDHDDEVDIGADYDDDESPSRRTKPVSHMDEGETAAERRRRLGALGVHNGDESDDDDDEGGAAHRGLGMRELPPEKSRAEKERERKEKEKEQQVRSPGIRFAPDPRASMSGSGSTPSGSGHARGDSQSLRWGNDVKGGRK